MSIDESRVLVFNRGEIAVRACLAARRLGLTPILFVTPDDLASPACRYAAELHLCAHSEARLSFSSLDEVTRAITATRCRWVYPGYGFLSETAELAEAVAAAGASFVGPSPAILRTMAHKARAKELANDAGLADLAVPLTLDADGLPLAPDAARFPLLLKAAAGGGGRGHTLVEAPDGLRAAFEKARDRATHLFGDGDLVAERFLRRARHVELQIFGVRGHGVALLGSRDCSLQRAYQKVIEEGPVAQRAHAAMAPFLPALLEALGRMEYAGAGTVELLWDPDTDAIAFIEVNPRIQVEHTVTEELIGEDLVEWQLREALGLGREALWDAARRHQAAALAHEGDHHAIEARIYAEDPSSGFAPDAGVLHHMDLAPTPFCRWDVGVTAGARVSPHYDPLLAKLVVRARTRSEALARLAACLDATRFHGVRTNVAFLTTLARHPIVQSDLHHTRWVESELLPSLAAPELPAALAQRLDVLPSLGTAAPTTAHEHGAHAWKRGHRT